MILMRAFCNTRSDFHMEKIDIFYIYLNFNLKLKRTDFFRKLAVLKENPIESISSKQPNPSQNYG